MITKALHITFAFCLLFAAQSYAQFGADFDVVSGEGCQAFTVSVIDNSGVPDDNVVVYNYGDGTPETKDTFHIYSSPDEYIITQIVANGNPRFFTRTIRVVDPVEPEFVLSNCQGPEAFIYVTDTLYNAYLVDWGDGNTSKVISGQLIQHTYGTLGIISVTVKGLMDPNLPASALANTNCFSRTKQITLVNDISEGEITRVEVLNKDSIHINYSLGPGTAYFLEVSEDGSFDFSNVKIVTSEDNPGGFTIGGLDTDAHYYCFRLTAFDPCNSTSKTSNVGCSVNLDVEAENNQNHLRWFSETADLNTYDIFKDGSLFSSTIATESQDTLVECGIRYCYQVVLRENNGLESLSNIRCDTAFSEDTPTAIENVSATVTDNIVVLSWDDVQPEPKFYSIIKSENGSAFPPIQTPESGYTDSTSVADRSHYSYEISYENWCNNQSASVVASPVFLSSSSGSSINWTPYQGWRSGINSYIIERYSEDGQLLSTTNVGSGATYTEEDAENLPQKIKYRIQVLPADPGLPAVYSNFYEKIFPSLVVFPNAFTPNGDGLNDLFNFKGKYISSYRLMVFTRWGELIFETDQMDTGWDGTFHAKPVPSGVYIFSAEFEDELGIKFTKKGEVYLLR